MQIAGKAGAEGYKKRKMLRGIPRSQGSLSAHDMRADLLAGGCRHRCHIQTNGSYWGPNEWGTDGLCIDHGANRIQLLLGDPRCRHLSLAIAAV